MIPVPDSMMGEKVGAVVVPTPDGLDTDAVIASVRERIAAFKVPQYLAVGQTPLPRSAPRKALKAQLRDETTWGDPQR